ncbi:DUF6543 domain-containing protein [Pseudomonas sp.]|uniref:dermonecrotic toxin domain-containing protein n=1 Tax=Pseudomonas sp. TaxID=306 RepID=UPI0026345B05|nr:DUF6543 domain-containing protein [Pseudomonas sp.]
MATDSQAYFFTEPRTDRTQLSERQRARNFTLKDLDWLDTLYLPTDDLRRAQKAPMHVQTVRLSVPGQQAIELAGAFVMSPAPEGGVFLYTPAGGLEKLQDDQALKARLGTWLKDPGQRPALLDYLSVSQRALLTPASVPSLTLHTVAGGVFEAQQNTLSNNLLENARLMREQLLKLPVFTALLDKYLATELAESFAGVDPRTIQVQSYVVDTSGHSSGTDTPAPRHVATRSLNETLLRYFITNGWPAGETRRYVNPEHIADPPQSSQQADEQLRWELSVQGLAQGLKTYVKQQAEAFWAVSTSVGLTRLQLFTHAMSQAFITVLLDQQQQSKITGEQRLQLQALPLKTEPVATASPGLIQVEKAMLEGPDQSSAELAGALIIRGNQAANDSACLLYSSGHHSLQVFTELDALKNHLLDSLNPRQYPDAWRKHLSMAQRYSEADLQARTVTHMPVTGGVFRTIMEGIIEKQGQNLEYALEQYRLSGGTMNLDALVDHVLDVRAMIDPQLSALDPMGRWSTQLASTWTASATKPEIPPTLLAKRLALHSLDNVIAEIERGIASRPSLERSATTYLNTRLRTPKQRHLHASCLAVHRYSSPSAAGGKPRLLSSISMVEYFLARVCGEVAALTDSPDTHIYATAPDKPATKTSDLDVTTFSDLIENAIADFTPYLRRTHNLYPNMLPLLRKAMEMGLTGEVQVRLWNDALLPLDYEVLLAVMGMYARDLRRSVNGFRPDAFCLSVTPAEEDTPHVLTHCFVVTERGGLDPLYSGRSLLWTPALGLESFHSLNALKAQVNRRLAAPDERLVFLEHLPQPDWHAHPTYVLSSLELIEANLVEHLQQSVAQQKERELEAMLSMQLSVQQLRNLWQVQITQNLAPTNLQRARDMVQSMIVQHGLQWFGQAGAVDQQLYIELLEQYRNNVIDNQDYLHEVDSLVEFTRKKLGGLLKDLDEQNPVTPDEIEVGLPAQGSLPARNQTLLDYALSHQSYWQDEVPLFASTGATPLPATMDAQTLTTRIQALNISAAYQAYVRSILGSASPTFTQRYTRWAKQLPWQLMQYAHTQTLQGQLSPAAFGLIQQIMDMPDATARTSVEGTNAVICPLELVVGAGKKTLKVPGAYLIGYGSGDETLHVLYAPYSPEHTLKEYADEAELLTELTSSGALHRWVLQVVGTQDQAAITSLLGQPPGSTGVQLAHVPIDAPLFKQLYNDNAELLVTLLGCQKKADAQATWATVKAVFSEGVQEAITFFAGKLAYPLVVWQSYQLFSASAEELQSHQWHDALGHFIGGVARLAGLRRSLAAAPEPSPAPPTATTSVVSWPALDITARSRTQLQRFETLEPTLASLTPDTAHHLYRTSRNDTYAAVAGKVFQVIEQGGGWRITGAGEVGPQIHRNTRQQWMISSSDPLLTGRRALARLTNRFYSEPFARPSMNILASGMREIRALYAQESLMITEALALATFYTRNAQENLRLLARSPLGAPEVVSRIKVFFGLHKLEIEHLNKMQEVVDKVCSALMDPSLSSPNSTRFVIGRSRVPTLAGTYKVMAFTIIPDPHQLLYLTEAFFSPGLQYTQLLIKPFYVNVHARATTLIHELTHHVCATLDLAYVLSTHPFADLIDPRTPKGNNTRTALENRHLLKLSLNTPVRELFQVVDIATGLKTDPAMGTSTEPLLTRLLTVTGAQTLNDARQVFRTDPLKRVLTVLNNADSVAYLITQLGRRKEIPVEQPGDER